MKDKNFNEKTQKLTLFSNKYWVFREEQYQSSDKLA